MNALTQPQLRGYEQFTTTVEGIELLCLMSYSPAEIYDGRQYPESAWCEYVLLNGQDITPLIYERLLDLIADRYLIERDIAENDARTERRIDALQERAA